MVMQPDHLLAAVVRSAGMGQVLENRPPRETFWRVAETVLGSGGACAEDDWGCAACDAGRGS
jgi:hypothetical protein